MRTLLLLGLAIGGAFMAGWFTIEREGDRTRIEINKTEIRSDARQAIDKGRDLLDKREQEQLARQQQEANFNANPNGWPPQAAPIQGAGYNGPAPYNPNGYQQPYAGQTQQGQTQQGQSQFGSQPGYNPNYQAPGGQPANAPRWTEMPPPWQQQTR